MKTSLPFLVASLFASASFGLELPAREVVVSQAPLKTAQTHLEKAKALLEQPAPKMPVINTKATLAQLSQASADLDQVKKNKGSHLPLAKKAVQAAETELNAATDDVHRAKALEQVNEALKQTIKAWNAVH